jgi:hypothetical protein
VTTEPNQATDEEAQRFRDFLTSLPPDRLAWFSRYADLSMQGDIVTQQAQEKLFIGRIPYGAFCKIVDKQHRLLLKNQANAVARMLNDHTQGGLEQAHKDEDG